jgi:hypothetical protein
MKRVLRRLDLAVKALRYGEIKPQVPGDIGQLTDEEVREVRTFFPMEKFFIFGHARSGTTLLARLIRVHPVVHCNWQAHFFTRPPFLSSLVSDPEVNEWLSRRSNRWNRGRDLSPLVMRAASDFILERETASLGKKVVGDKSPNNLVNGEAVRRLAGIYPDARLIFIVRDGRDAVLSHQIQKFIDLPDLLTAEESAIRRSVITDPQRFLAEKRSLFTPDGLRKAAQDWVLNVTETNRLGEEIFAEAYLSVRFEDILDDPKFSLGRIWDFLGVDSGSPDLGKALDRELSENPDADWQRSKQQQVAELLRKGLPGSWRDIYTAEDLEIFMQNAGNTLAEWGYAENRNFQING